jgi:outer membrane receptor protein involved in Fe transport
MRSDSSIKRTKRRTSVRYRVHVGLFVALAALFVGSAAFAQQHNTESTPQDYSITAGSLGDALNQLATQSRLQIVYSPELVGGKTAPAIGGRLTWRQALQKLLAGSGLEWNFVNETTVVIRRSGNDTKPTRPAASRQKPAKKPEQQSEPVALQAVTVTGTRIRGGVTASPTISIDALQMHREGFTDLGDVIRSIPQNFSGGQNPGVTAGASAGGIANQNITGSSALNLRGLGPDATLTLLNGRRLTYDGFAQAVDISAIPLEAVERIEIIPDGASAIYGSDAVAGVANVMLKRDFEGVTLGALYGDATNGGLGTHEYTVTAGTTWASGGLIATYKKASQDPIFADQRNYTRVMDDPTTLYGDSDLRSGLVSAYQLFGDVAKLSVDALRTDRDGSYYIAYPGIYFDEARQTSIMQVAPSVEFSLPADWTLTLGGAYGRDESVVLSSSVAGGLRSAPRTLCYCNKSHSYEAGAEGPLFPLMGGDARLAAGVGSRTNESEVSDSVPGGKERSTYSYAELSMPLVDPLSETKGMRRLELSAAVRIEDYDSFGRVTTPKLGVIYGPSADFTFKTSWGKSFKAPTLLQRYQARSAYLWTAQQLGGTAYPADATVLMAFGGNPDLKPERARSWTASVQFHPEALPGLDVELTYFDIDYTERVVQPIRSFIQTLSIPDYAEFIQYAPTLEQQAALLNTYNQAFRDNTGMGYDPSKVVALVSDQYTNAARQRIKGVDLSGSYGFDLGGGRLVLRGAGTWLDSSQQTSAGQPVFDLSGTIFNPAKIRGRLGATWARGGFAVSGFANYTGGVTSKLTGPAEKTASATTLDATVSYGTGEREDALSGIEFVFSAQNLLDRDPPLYTPPVTSYAPYDSTSYSAIGRYLSLSVSKHW